MKKNNIIRFAQSLVLLPTMAVSLSLGGAQVGPVSHNVSAKKMNIEAIGTLALNQAMIAQANSSNDTAALDQVELDAKAAAIDSYYEDHNMPLKGMGKKMVLEADKNDLDWRLLPAISVRESTGGRAACIKVKHNAFGWASCKVGFKSDEEAIETVARNLGGNNPKTAVHYDNKTTLEILHAYNPPSIIPKYAEQVISIMKNIGDSDSQNLAVS